MVDITKFQNFVITVVLVLGYIGLAVHTITAAGYATKVTALPGFSGTFLVLLGISHAAYLAGKLPSPAGQPTGLSVESRDVLAWAAARAVALAAEQPIGPRWGQLWRYGANVIIWSDGAPFGEVPAGRTLVITDAHPFVLHWTADSWQQPAHDDTAISVADGRYAVMLTPSELAGATAVQFTRRYLDRRASAGPHGGWEGTPATDHLVLLLPPEALTRERR